VHRRHKSPHCLLAEAATYLQALPNKKKLFQKMEAERNDLLDLGPEQLPIVPLQMKSQFHF